MGRRRRSAQAPILAIVSQVGFVFHNPLSVRRRRIVLDRRAVLASYAAWHPEPTFTPSVSERRDPRDRERASLRNCRLPPFFITAARKGVRTAVEPSPTSPSLGRHRSVARDG